MSNGVKKIQPVGRTRANYSTIRGDIKYGCSGEHKAYQQVTRLIEKGKTDQIKKIEGVVLSDLSYKEAIRLSNKLKKKYAKKVDKILDGYEANMAAVNDEYSTFSEANLADSIDEEKIKELHSEVGRYIRIKNDNLPQSTVLMLEAKEYEAIDMKVSNLDIAFQELFKEEINADFKEVLEIDLDKEIKDGEESN
jgi:hypothetical protein